MRLVDAWASTGRPSRQWDDIRRVFTSWDEDGNVTEDRPYSDTENADADARLAAANDQAAAAATLDSKMDAALAANQAFLAIASPTAAQVRDQTRLLTRQMNAAIRYMTGRLDSTDGT